MFICPYSLIYNQRYWWAPKYWAETTLISKSPRVSARYTHLFRWYCDQLKWYRCAGSLMSHRELPSGDRRVLSGISASVLTWPNAIRTDLQLLMVMIVCRVLVWSLVTLPVSHSCHQQLEQVVGLGENPGSALQFVLPTITIPPV